MQLLHAQQKNITENLTCESPSTVGCRLVIAVNRNAEGIVATWFKIT